MAVTLKDIAARVGVSIATVSRILNGRETGGLIREETRQKVFAVADELGYRPNLLARGLRGSHSSLIGVIVRDIADPFMSAALKGIHGVAVKRGYRLFLGNAEQPNTAIDYGAMFDQSHADGILLLGDLKEDEAAVEFLSSKHRYIVGMVDRTTRRKFPGVYTDNVLGTHLALEHLWSLGHRRIFCVSDGGAHDRNLRAATYEQWMREHGLEDHIRVLLTAQSSTAAFETGQDLFSGTDIPNAIFAATDRMAIGLMRAAFEASISVPSQVSIVGFDDLEIARFVTPPLTTISQSPLKMGGIAAQLLLDMVEQQLDSAEVQDVIMTPELVVRQSTASAKLVPNKQGAT